METGNLLINEQFLPAACDLVVSAKRIIYISTFKAELTTKPRGRSLTKFFELVFEKSRLGLDVRVLITKRENYGHVPTSNAYAVRMLKEKKVAVRHLQNDRVVHAKLLIVDDDIAIIGSHNLSVKSCHSNFEVSYMCHDIYAVGQLIGIYQGVWENAKVG